LVAEVGRLEEREQERVEEQEGGGAGGCTKVRPPRAAFSLKEG